MYLIADQSAQTTSFFPKTVMIPSGTAHTYVPPRTPLGLKVINPAVLGSMRIPNVWFQKMSILPPQKGLEIPGGGVSKARSLIGIFRGVGIFILRKNPFRGGGMDNLWNHSIWFGHVYCRENLSITCSMDMESTLGQMVHFMKETSMKISKNLKPLAT